MKKEKRDDRTFDYESNFTYAQKLNRGKRLRTGISMQNFAARLLAIILMVLCSLFIIIPLIHNIRAADCCDYCGGTYRAVCACVLHPRDGKTRKARPCA